MRVVIGPYPKFIGVRQIASLFPKMLRPHIEKLGWLDRLCNYLYEKKKIKKEIILHPYDTWSADYTLSLIIVPVLKQLKDTSNTYGMVDEPDVPEGIEKESLEAWHWALDMMIEAFTSDIDKEWESQYVSGKMDYIITEEGGIIEGAYHTYDIDKEGYESRRNKIKRGRELFAKYYNQLWD